MLNRRRGFSLTELLIVIGIIAVLLAILIAVIGKSRESAKRVTCANNLRQIGVSVVRYGQEFGELPRTAYSEGVGLTGPAVAPSAFSGRLCSRQFPLGSEGANPVGATTQDGNPASPNTAGGDKYPRRNDVTAGMFLLLRTYQLPSATFICPSSDGVADTFGGSVPAQRGNFTEPKNLTYSFALQYPWLYQLASGTGGYSKWGYYYGADMSGNLPLAADISPGNLGASPEAFELTLASPETDMRRGNSINHGKKGQNVLYYDGRVDWMDTPFAGVDRDNIYTRSVASTDPGFAQKASDTAQPFGGMPPRSGADSLLLPTSSATPIKAW